jgi:hypothetical protein
MNEDFSESIGVQYAKKRVLSSKDKLNGINPCVITRNDLLQGIHKDSKYLKYILNVVLGQDQNSENKLLRSKLLTEKGEKYKLTVEEQVKCIIEQATDPNILSRCYTGWQSFI